MRRTAAVALALAAALTACSAPTDSDGEAVPPGGLVAAPAKLDDAVPVVVDTDLGADDLLALAYVLRHPGVRVAAVTVASTGLGSCPSSVDVAGDLFIALDVDPVPIACGRAERGAAGRPFPLPWRMAAMSGSGLPRDLGPTTPAVAEPAAELIASLAVGTPGLTVLALGPLTNVADVATQFPDAYAQLAGVHAMGGLVEGEGEDGIGEWNVAADPQAAVVVLDAGVPVTLVPADAVPSGTPDALRAPVIGQVVAATPVQTWWDLAAAAAFTDPRTAGPVESGTWSIDVDVEPGRLDRKAQSRDGTVRVVRHLDEDALARAYAAVFGVRL